MSDDASTTSTNPSFTPPTHTRSSKARVSQPTNPSRRGCPRKRASHLRHGAGKQQQKSQASGVAVRGGRGRRRRRRNNRYGGRKLKQSASAGRTAEGPSSLGDAGKDVQEWFPNICAREWTPEKQWQEPKGVEANAWVNALKAAPVQGDKKSDNSNCPNPNPNPNTEFPVEVVALCNDLVEAVVSAAERKRRRKKIKRLQEKWKAHAAKRSKETPNETLEASTKGEDRVTSSLGSSATRRYAPTEHEMILLRKEVRKAQESKPAIAAEKFIQAVREEDFKLLLRWYNDCVSKGLDVAKTLNNMEQKYGSLVMGALKAESPDIIPMLLQWGLRVSPKSKCSSSGEGPLLLALDIGNEHVVHCLLRHMSQSISFSIDERGDGNQTALHKACFHGNVPIVKLLLSYGASATLRDSSGFTALHHAVQSGDPEVIRVLLRGKKVKVSLESKDKYQDTPLKIAVRLGYTACATELIQSGAIPSCKMDALFLVEFAVRHGALDIVRLLIEKGAYVREEDGSQLSSSQQEWISVCATVGGLSMLKLLVELSEAYGLGLYLQRAEYVEELDLSTWEHDPVLPVALDFSHWNVVRWLVVEKGLIVSKHTINRAFLQLFKDLYCEQFHMPLSLFGILVQAFLYAPSYSASELQLKQRLAYLKSRMEEAFTGTVRAGASDKLGGFLPYAGVLFRIWPESELDSIASLVVEACSTTSGWDEEEVPAVPSRRSKSNLWGRALKRQQSGSIDEVAVVLDSGEILHLNKSMLSCRCDFFKSMFTHTWRESQSSQVDLTGFDSTTMIAFLEYLYNGELDEVERMQLKKQKNSTVATRLAEDLLCKFNRATGSSVSIDSINIPVQRLAAIKLCLNLVDAADYFMVGEQLRSYAGSGIIWAARLAEEPRGKISNLMNYAVDLVEQAGPIHYSGLRQNGYRTVAEWQAGKSVTKAYPGSPGFSELQSPRLVHDPQWLRFAEEAMKADLKALWDQTEFADCVLVTDDSCELRLHTVVLDYHAPQYERFEVERRVDEGIRVFNISSTGVSGKVAQKLMRFCYSRERVLVSSMKEIQEILKGAVELGIENVPESLFTDSTFSTENMDFPYKGALSLSPGLHSIDAAIYSTLVKEVRTKPHLRNAVIRAYLKEQASEANAFTNDVVLALFALLHARFTAPLSNDPT